MSTTPHVYVPAYSLLPSASSLRHQPGPACVSVDEIVSVDDVSFLFDPFPMLCLFLCLITGRVKTILHHEGPAVILDETEHLRCILPADCFENRNASFWIPRRAIDRKKTNVERMWRSRLHRTLRGPYWHGEPPKPGTVGLRSNFPSLGYLLYLAGLGYPWVAASAALSRAHAPWSHPHSDKRRNTCTSSGEIEREGERSADPGYDPKYDSQEYFDPYRPYVPASPARRTKVGGGFTRLQVVGAIAKHGWDTETSCALYEIFFKGKPTKVAAEERGLRVTTLYQYASIIRKDIRGTGGA
jgi:hypothetical protein